MVDKNISCAFGVDLDAVCGWLGSYGGEDSPDDISRGMFAGEVGTPRLLKLFDRLGVKTTWFVPGHSIETFPTECRMIVDGGHEIGMHGYSHENPIYVPGSGGGGVGKVHRSYYQRFWQPPYGLRCSLVGIQSHN